MCAHYQTLKDAEKLLKQFGANAPERPYLYDIRSGFDGLFVRRPIGRAGREAVVGHWGLARRGTRVSPKASTFNARSDRLETARTLPEAWQASQRCIIPAAAIFEPDWRQKYQIATRFTRSDCAPLGLAGLWDVAVDAGGEPMETYAIITVNTEDHALFKLYHGLNDEKRMIVLLLDEAPDADASQAMAMLHGASAEAWIANPCQRATRPICRSSF